MAAPTAIKGGLLVDGFPVTPGGQIPVTTGTYFYVHSGTGSSGYDGLSPQNPMATIAQAVNKCTANKGDVIIVLPGHAENISAATSLVVDVAGVQIIGLGHGRNRPVLTYTNTAGTIEMDAANTRLSNVVLFASVSAVVVGINIDADNVTLDNLEFNYDATGDDFITMVDVDAFDGCTIANCRFISQSTAAGAAEAIRLDDCHFVRIINNQFSGQWSDAAIVGEGAAGIDILISDNTIYNADTTTGNGIALAVAFTGILARNMIGTLYATDPESALDPGSLLCMENYIANAVDETGTIVPVTAST